MAAIIKLTLLALVVCFVCFFGTSSAKEDKLRGQVRSPTGHEVQNGRQSQQGQQSQHREQGHESRHFVKREADYQDDDSYQRPEYSSFERPRRIHVLPGFLH